MIRRGVHKYFNISSPDNVTKTSRGRNVGGGFSPVKHFLEYLHVSFKSKAYGPLFVCLFVSRTSCKTLEDALPYDGLSIS